MTVLKLSLQN